VGSVLRWTLVVAIATGTGGCDQDASRAQSKGARENAGTGASQAGPASPAQGSPLCGELSRADQESSSEKVISLRPPGSGKAMVLSKTGVIVRFNREDFLAAARCLGLDKARSYIETQTGATQESPLRDAFQLSYVAAALLDVGRASVRRKDDDTQQTSIVREPWAAEGCAGACRSSGRLYRVSKGDTGFFFRITDETVNERE
jgi:hypothetical protein